MLVGSCCRGIELVTGSLVSVAVEESPAICVMVDVGEELVVDVVVLVLVAVVSGVVVMSGVVDVSVPDSVSVVGLVRVDVSSLA